MGRVHAKSSLASQKGVWNPQTRSNSLDCSKDSKPLMGPLWVKLVLIVTVLNRFAYR